MLCFRHAWSWPLFSISGWRKEDGVRMGRGLLQDLSFPRSVPRSAQTLCMAWGKSLKLNFPSVNSRYYCKCMYCQGREELERGRVTRAAANTSTYDGLGGKSALFPSTQPKSAQDDVNKTIAYPGFGKGTFPLNYFRWALLCSGCAGGTSVSRAVREDPSLCEAQSTSKPLWWPAQL